MRFAVIGHPVTHSLSPLMHTANFRALGFEGIYEKVDVAPAELGGALKRFADLHYRGINCTIPHKVAVMALMTHLDESAVCCGAVNTVRFDPGGATTGFNTDVFGFAAALARALKAGGEEPDLSGAKVLILGAGGAARAAAAAALKAGCTELTVANRTLPKASALVEALRPLSGNSRFVSGAWPSEAGAFDIVVNATSIGLKADDPSILPSSAFHRGQLVYDLIPLKRETATLAAAKAAGARTLGGLGMLAFQGAQSFHLWTGLKPDVGAFERALVLAG